jgi:glucosylceramidase
MTCRKETGRTALFRFSSAIVWVVWVVAIPGLFLSLGGCDDSESSAPPPPTPPAVKEIGKAQAWLTTGDKSNLLTKQTDLSIIEEASTSQPVLTVNADQTYQEIEGFGAALTGSSAYLINKELNASQRQALLNDLFHPTNGIGISAIRLTIGASDFSLSSYTYNDVAAGQTDFDLSGFSIAPEQENLLPVLTTINSISPSVTVIASPWTAPAWMKSNGSLNGGSLNTEAYEAYANYFVRYIEAMKDAGTVIDAITIQNEPLHTAGYPSMSMTAEEQKNFLKNNLGPTFEANSIDTKIIIYDHNWDITQYAISILNDATAKQYAAGSAFHAYAGNVSAMSVVRNAHPDRGIYFTEISGGEWATDFSSNLQWNMQNIFIGTMKNWSKTALLWNLALDENHGPKNNGCDNCRGVVTINSSTGAVTKNVEYYSIGHFSKFVRNGAFRIGTSISSAVSDVDFVAFKNPDNTRAIVFSNSGSSTQSLVVREAGKQFSVSLPPTSVTTITWE